MKVFCHQSAGLSDSPSNAPQERGFDQALRIFRGLSREGSFMGIELDSDQTLQMLRESEGTFRVELLNLQSHSFEYCTLNAPLVENLIEAAYAGTDLKEAIAFARIEWRLDHF